MRESKKRWNETAERLNEGERFCTCCHRDLSGHAVRMLERDNRIQGFHDFGGVPEDESQGSFPFGLACAKKQLTLSDAALTAKGL